MGQTWLRDKKSPLSCLALAEFVCYRCLDCNNTLLDDNSLAGLFEDILLGSLPVFDMQESSIISQAVHILDKLAHTKTSALKPKFFHEVKKKTIEGDNQSGLFSNSKASALHSLWSLGYLGPEDKQKVFSFYRMFADTKPEIFNIKASHLICPLACLCDREEFRGLTQVALNLARNENSSKCTGDIALALLAQGFNPAEVLNLDEYDRSKIVLNGTNLNLFGDHLHLRFVPGPGKRSARIIAPRCFTCSPDAGLIRGRNKLVHKILSEHFEIQIVM